MEGTVHKSTGSNYIVKTNNGFVTAKIRGKFRIKGIKATNPVAVGDRVVLIEENNQWIINEIKERRNYLIRRATNLSKQYHIVAANVDQVFVIATLAAPYTTYEFIDRISISAEAYDIPFVIILNKIDLLQKGKEKMLYGQFLENYEKAGIQVIETSVKNNIGIDDVLELFQKKTTLITGHSGVGKSSLIKAIDANLNLKVSTVSDFHKTGKHTTTFAEMFELEHQNANIIDTPGLRAFGIIDFEKENLSHYFKEFQPFLGDCKFPNCRHINEPGCIIKEKLESGEISTYRYKSYLNLFEEEYNPYRQ